VDGHLAGRFAVGSNQLSSVVGAEGRVLDSFEECAAGERFELIGPNGPRFFSGLL